MRTPRLLRRHPRVIGVLSGLAVLAGLLVAPALPASAADGLVQVNPTQGATVAGTAFSDQLQVSGSTGTVSFSQTSGSDVAVSSSGHVSGPSSLAVGKYSVSGTDSDTGGDTGSWTYSLIVVAPAPSDFADTVVGVYQSEYSVAQQLGQTSSLQSVAQYSQAVGQLNPAQLAELYNAVSQNPEWFQIPSLMQTVASDVPGSGSTSSFTSNSASTKSGSLKGFSPAKTTTTPAKAGARSAKVSHPASVRGTRSNLTPADSAVTSVSRFTPATCSTAVPDAAVFALQIVVDAAQGAYNLILATAIAFIDGIAAQAPFGIAAAVAGGVLLAAVIVHDVLAFEQQLQNECAGNNVANEVDNIDNTTVATYGLLTGLATTVTQISTTDNAVLTDVQAIQNQLTTLQTTLIQTISNDTQTLQTTIGSDTQAITTQIQTDISGLHEDLTTVDNDLRTVTQNVINQVNTDSSAVQSSLSSDLTKIMSETDADANSLTSVVNAGDQQIINLLQSNNSTQQSEINLGLTLDIESALSMFGSDVPPVEYMTPASQNGMLNSTPVGVQEVVTTDINTIASLGGKVGNPATSALKQANAALAAGQYITAYDEFATAYQDFA